MSQIVIVAPDEQIAYITRRFLNKPELKDITIVIGALQDGLVAYQKEIKEPPLVMISRGGTAVLLRKAYPAIPVIDIPLSPYDWIRTIQRVKAISDQIAVVGFSHISYSLTKDVQEILEKTFSVSLTKIIVSSLDELTLTLKKINENGTMALIGGRGVLSAGQKFGFRGVVLDAGAESIKQAFDEARRMITFLDKEKENSRRMQLLISSIAEGVLAIDEKGRISMINKAAEKLLNCEGSDLVGEKLADRFPNHLLLECLKTKSASWGSVEKYGENVLASNRFPIIVNDQLFGAVSTFQEAQKLKYIESNVRKSLLEKGSFAKRSFDQVICHSESSNKLIEKAKLMANNDSTILISGETGTGKEVFAQSIHNYSYRKDAPFVAINCSALPASILESEIFGYVEGAFTGAKKSGKAGLFEVAHEGTIFLDEISEMPIELQTRLLRVLQEKEVMRLGDSCIIPIDVKVIASTNRDLILEVKEGRFREDLYYRLNVLRLAIPPLRHRKDDILPLLLHFIQKRTRISWHVEEEAKLLILNYPWPGNIRQLENMAERLRVLCQNPVVKAVDFRSAMEGEDLELEVSNNPISILQNADYKVVKSVLTETGGNRGEAAKKLGMSRTTLWRKLRKHEQSANK